MNKVVVALVAIAIVTGVGLTVRDYKIWHHLEADKLGQGSVAEMGLSPVQALGLPYSSYVGKFRIKAPAGWVVTENESLKSMRPVPLLGKSLTKIVNFKDPNSSAQISVLGMQANTNVTEGSNAMAEGITRDRQYISVNNIPMTILTWDKSDHVEQKVVLISNGNLFVLEVSTSVDAWKIWTKTFDAIYQTWVQI